VNPHQDPENYLNRGAALLTSEQRFDYGPWRVHVNCPAWRFLLIFKTTSPTPASAYAFRCDRNYRNISTITFPTNGTIPAQNVVFTIRDTPAFCAEMIQYHSIYRLWGNIASGKSEVVTMFRTLAPAGFSCCGDFAVNFTDDGGCPPTKESGGTTYQMTSLAADINAPTTALGKFQRSVQATHYESMPDVSAAGGAISMKYWPVAVSNVWVKPVVRTDAAAIAANPHYGNSKYVVWQTSGDSYATCGLMATFQRSLVYLDATPMIGHVWCSSGFDNKRITDMTHMIPLVGGLGPACCNGDSTVDKEQCGSYKPGESICDSLMFTFCEKNMPGVVNNAPDCGCFSTVSAHKYPLCTDNGCIQTGAYKSTKNRGMAGNPCAQVDCSVVIDSKGLKGFNANIGQNCGNTGSPGNPSTPGTTPSSGGTTTPSSDGTGDGGGHMTMMMMMLILIILIAIGYLLLM
jgi:hypothetical protein